MKKQIHDKICKNLPLLQDWYQKKISEFPIPIYCSYDIRDSGYKVSNVDANIFPAGFNNICPADREQAPALFENYLTRNYGSNIQNVLLITEEHTNNPFYWNNVATIKHLIEESGRQVRLAFPSLLNNPLQVKSAIGEDLTVFSGDISSPQYSDFKPDIIISNNDFSDAKEEWASMMSLPMNPPREYGWYQRKKSMYFKYYNQLATEFCNLIDLDPFYLTIKTVYFNGFEIKDENSVNQLADEVDKMLAELKIEYQKRDIDQEPFVFVKNNSGTYGLAVIKVSSGDEVRKWNYKSRKKMKAAKGGREVEEVIIQEGIPSIVKSDNSTAEPVIYMVGCQLAGGFLRTHAEKSESESLNSPGAVYKRLCISDLGLKPSGCLLENVYGWSAKIGLLAIAQEGKEMGVTFKNLTQSTC